MKIYIGTDHAGFELKNTLLVYLASLGHKVKDMGAFEYDKADDYPDFVIPVAKEVAKDKESMGIVIGNSGQGEAIAANAVTGARAIVFYGGDIDIVRLGRQHNNSNILSLGAGFLSAEEAKIAVKTWLDTEFSEEERHTRRILKMDSLM